MSTVAPQAASTGRRSPMDVLSEIVASIRTAPKAARAGLLGAALMVLAFMTTAVLPGTEISPATILVQTILCAAVLYAVLGKQALIAVLSIFGFTLVGIRMIGSLPAQGQRVVNLAEDSTSFSGTVRDHVTRKPLANATVRVEWPTGMRSGITDPAGHFTIRAPSAAVHEGKVTLGIEDTLGSEYHVEKPATPQMVVLVPPGADAAAVPVHQPPPTALMTVARWPRELPARPSPAERFLRPEQEGVTVAVILDSIRAVRDGSRGGSHWSFDLSLGGRPMVSLPAAEYNAHGDHRVVPVGAEAQLQASAGAPVELSITGIRRTYMVIPRIYRISGGAQVPTSSGRTVWRDVIRVTNQDDSILAEFHFYCTFVIRHARSAA